MTFAHPCPSPHARERGSPECFMTLPTTPSFRLDGRRALVTGAGRGIGLAAAAALADAGAHVTLVARSAEEVEAGAAAIRAGGGSADAQACDVTDLHRFARVRPHRGPPHAVLTKT